MSFKLLFKRVYALYSVLYAMCPCPFIKYAFPFEACLVLSMYDVFKNPFACFNSFIIWAKIALFVSIFVATGLLCYMGKIMHACSNYNVVWWLLLSSYFKT